MRLRTLKIGFILTITFSTLSLLAQGEFAGGHASFVGKTFKDVKHCFVIDGFSHYQYMILPDNLFVSWHYKDNLDLLVFSQVRGKDHTILDLLEKQTVGELELKMGDCWVGGQKELNVIALVKVSDKDEIAIEAWLFDLHKKRLQKYDTTSVICPNKK